MPFSFKALKLLKFLVFYSNLFEFISKKDETKFNKFEFDAYRIYYDNDYRKKKILNSLKFTYPSS